MIKQRGLFKNIKEYSLHFLPIIKYLVCYIAIKKCLFLIHFLAFKILPKFEIYPLLCHRSTYITIFVLRQAAEKQYKSQECTKSKFVQEVAKCSKDPYPLKTLYQIACGICQLMVAKNPAIEFNPLDSSYKSHLNWQYWRGGVMYTADLLQAQHEIKHVWRLSVNTLHGVRIVGFQAPPNKTQRKDMAEGYANALYNWPTMNWAAMDLSKEWERFYQHCNFAF